MTEMVTQDEILERLTDVIEHHTEIGAESDLPDLTAGEIVRLQNAIDRQGRFVQMWLEEYGDKLPAPAREKYERFLINDNQACGKASTEGD